MEETWSLLHGKPYLLESEETLNLPVSPLVTCEIIPRSTMFRAMVQITCGRVHPNYQGKIIVLAVPMHAQGLNIEKGARFITAFFQKWPPGANVNIYNGVWGTEGHAVTTNGKAERPY
jgi:deoxycytidine triphosphate deaminase